MTCPAAGVNKLTFDGQGLHDSFINNTASLRGPRWPGIEFFKGGAGPDTFYGDGDSTT